jgi:phosphohistidine phosphatase
MELYLMRHGNALPVGGRIKTDSDRPLSPQGREGVRVMAAQLNTADVHPARVLSSPLIRAVETANLMLSCAGSGVAVELKPTLSHGTSVEKIWRLLREKPETESVLIVGHQPDLGFMLQVLMADKVPEDIDAFPPATICGFSVTDLASLSASFLWVKRIF